MMQQKLTRVALRTSLLYAFFAALWILLSDRLLIALVSDPAVIGRLSTYKGWFFVLVTASLLYVTLRRPLRQWEQEAAVRRQVEEVLREYERVIENSRDMIAVLDQDYKYVLTAHSSNPAD